MKDAPSNIVLHWTHGNDDRHTRLLRRRAVYYHRTAVPVDIRASYPKSEETFSLKTKNYQEALRLVRLAAVKVDHRLDAHRLERVAEQIQAERLVARDLSNTHILETSGIFTIRICLVRMTSSVLQGSMKALSWKSQRQPTRRQRHRRSAREHKGGLCPCQNWRLLLRGSKGDFDVGEREYKTG